MVIERYRQALEQLGADVVRHRLANRLPIGDGAENLPYDQAKAWLAEKDATRKFSENARFWVILIVAVISAVAAVIAALPVIKSWNG